MTTKLQTNILISQKYGHIVAIKKLKKSWKYGQNVTQELYTKIYLAIVESNLEL
jgi:hypothetical protein